MHEGVFLAIEYAGANREGRVVPKFEKWNFKEMDELAKLKKGAIDHEGDFIETSEEYFTPYY
jgi:hypothetical protein